MKTERVRVFLSLGVGSAAGVCGAIAGALLAALIGANPVTGMVFGCAIVFAAAASFTFAVL